MFLDSTQLPASYGISVLNDGSLLVPTHAWRDGDVFKNDLSCFWFRTEIVKRYPQAQQTLFSNIQWSSDQSNVLFSASCSACSDEEQPKWTF